MKKYIAEDLPKRKFPVQSSSSSFGDKKSSSDDVKTQSPSGPGSSMSKKDDKTPGGESGDDKKVRQAVYDIRYRARREEISIMQAYSQYMQNSTLSGAEKIEVRKRLMGSEEKGGGNQSDAPGGGGDKNSMKESYDINDLASSSVAKAMYKVFVEGVGPTPEDYAEAYLNERTYKDEELVGQEKGGKIREKKFKVRVTDESGVSYVRYANRKKVNELRANPQIKSVEMTEYGKPYEGEKSAKPEGNRKNIKGPSKLDKVGKEDSDIDNDGKVTKKDKYLQNRRNVIGSKIEASKKEDVKEAKNYRTAKEKIIHPMKGTNKVIVNPEEKKERTNIMSSYETSGVILSEKAKSDAQQKFMGMVYAAKKGKKAASPEVAKAAKSMTKKEARKFAATKHSGIPSHVKEGCGCEDGKKDPREGYAEKEVLKNKLRSMGLKMSYEPSGTLMSEELPNFGITRAVADLGSRILSTPRESEQSIRADADRTVNLLSRPGKAVKRAGATVLNALFKVSDEKNRAMMNKRRPQGRIPTGETRRGSF